MKKFLFIVCTTILLGFSGFSALLLVLFTSNILRELSIDHLEAKNGLLLSWAINLLLLILFGLQHSIMARKGFKLLLQQWIPKELERMVFSVASSIVLILLVYLWQPIPIVLWDIQIEWIKICLYALFFLGWLLVIVAANLIDPFSFSGVRQLAVFFLGKKPQETQFSTPIVYKLIRHPLYLGLLIAFWATPLMTLSHFLFSLGMTIYIWIGIAYEEKDLVERYGDEYREYQKKTPKLFPRKLSLN